MNCQAVYAINSGIILLGGGLMKHHICNANLMVGRTLPRYYIWSLSIHNYARYSVIDKCINIFLWCKIIGRSAKLCVQYKIEEWLKTRENAHLEMQDKRPCLRILVLNFPVFLSVISRILYFIGCLVGALPHLCLRHAF